MSAVPKTVLLSVLNCVIPTIALFGDDVPPILTSQYHLPEESPIVEPCTSLVPEVP